MATGSPSSNHNLTAVSNCRRIASNLVTVIVGAAGWVMLGLSRAYPVNAHSP